VLHDKINVSQAQRAERSLSAFLFELTVPKNFSGTFCPSKEKVTSVRWRQDTPQISAHIMKLTNPGSVPVYVPPMPIFD